MALIQSQLVEKWYFPFIILSAVSFFINTLQFADLGVNMAEQSRRIAAIGAHPDDVEFMCSGTLKLLKDAGFEIHIGVLANGDCGSMVEPPEEITKIRRREAEDAAALLEAVFHPMGELDLRIEFDEPTRMEVTEYIRMIDPLIVFTHPHEDYMNDHEYTSKLVRHACFAAPIPN